MNEIMNTSQNPNSQTISAPSQLDRIEALLTQANSLRSEAIALQKQSISEQQGHLAKASLINDQALAMQQRARPLVKVLFAAIFIVVGLAIYTSFFRR